jgi:hypothetical protein
MIPADFPKRNTIYFYYGIWSEKKGRNRSILEKVLKNRYQCRTTGNYERIKLPFALLTRKVRETRIPPKKGYDAGKNIRGHIATDANDLPHAVYVTAAGVTDRSGAVETIKINRDSLS